MEINQAPERDSTGKIIHRLLPFANKEVDGKQLYKRVHGIRHSCSIGWNDIYFTIPYNTCKITGAEFIGGEVGDYSDFWILDSVSGVITTIPNYPLNQFGFEVNISDNIYSHTSEYEADLQIDLQIWIRYNSKTAKDIGVNFILNETKL